MGGGSSGGESVQYTIVYCTLSPQCVCGGRVVGGKCVKLCTAHVSVCVGGE